MRIGETTALEGTDSMTRHKGSEDLSQRNNRRKEKGQGLVTIAYEEKKGLRDQLLTRSGKGRGLQRGEEGVRPGIRSPDESAKEWTKKKGTGWSGTTEEAEGRAEELKEEQGVVGYCLTVTQGKRRKN